MIDAQALATILMIAAHMEQEGDGMKTSEIEKARGLHRHAKFYDKLLLWLGDYPGYDAVLVINGEELMVSRDEARPIIERYQSKNSAEMAAIGLEFDE